MRVVGFTQDAQLLFASALLSLQPQLVLFASVRQGLEVPHGIVIDNVIELYVQLVFLFVGAAHDCQTLFVEHKLVEHKVVEHKQ